MIGRRNRRGGERSHWMVMVKLSPLLLRQPSPPAGASSPVCSHGSRQHSSLRHDTLCKGKPYIVTLRAMLVCSSCTCLPLYSQLVPAILFHTPWPSSMFFVEHLLTVHNDLQGTIESAVEKQK